MRMIAAGTKVRIKGAVLGGAPGVGRLMEDVYGDSLAQVMTDGGPVTCTGSELVVPRDQSPMPEPMRYRLPYGLWTCVDGREVLFNRDYKPIWQRHSGEAATVADRDEWISYVDQKWFYGDHSAPWLKGREAQATLAQCEDTLAVWGVAHLSRETEVPA
jgi:hypothetical protein